MALDLDAHVSRSEPAPATADRLEFVRCHWLEGQVGYFRDRLDICRVVQKNIEEHHDLWGSVFVIANLVLAIAGTVTFYLYATKGGQYYTWSDVKRPVLGLLMVAAGGAALRRGYQEQESYRSLILEYKKMEWVFSRAKDSIGIQLAQSNLSAARETLRYLGIEALRENSAWYVLRRERMLRVPERD